MLAVLLNVPVETFESRDFKENVYIDFNNLSFPIALSKDIITDT